MLLTAGAYNIMWGGAAIAGQSYFTPDELLLDSLDEQVWGALSLAWGCALALVAVLMFAGRRIGTTIGLAIVITNIPVQLLGIADFPGWTIAVVALDLFLVFALTRARRTIDRAGPQTSAA